MPTASDFRRLALPLDGVGEAPHFDRAAFRARRIFATLAADGLSANFRFAPEEQEFSCLLAPEAFSPIPGAWGKQGWTRGELTKLSEAELIKALAMAYSHATEKRDPKERKSPGAKMNRRRRV